MPFQPQTLTELSAVNSPPPAPLTFSAGHEQQAVCPKPDSAVVLPPPPSLTPADEPPVITTQQS